jgi:hypothetical protein
MPDITTLGLPISETLEPFQEAANSVRSRALAAPPASPAEGDRYLIAAGATGDWSGHAQQIARRAGSGWAFTVPTEGFSLWIDDEDITLVYDGTAWIVPQTAPPGRANYTADEALSALRVVRRSSDGRVLYARLPELEARAPLGVTAHAADSGATIAVVTAGPLSDSSWNWTVGRPVLLGASGVLTQTQPAEFDALVVIGLAVASDAIVVRIMPPVYLAA